MLIVCMVLRCTGCLQNLLLGRYESEVKAAQEYDRAVTF